MTSINQYCEKKERLTIRRRKRFYVLEIENSYQSLRELEENDPKHQCNQLCELLIDFDYLVHNRFVR